jgi:DNA-binding transcriptional ArsR family regulator
MHADEEAGSSEPDPLHVELAVEVFAMLADVSRVRIVLALRDRELSVTTLAEILQRTPAAVSQHLAKMRMARLVVPRQDGQRVYYRLAGEHAAQLVDAAIFQAEHAVDDHPRHHRKPS